MNLIPDNLWLYYHVLVSALVCVLSHVRLFVTPWSIACQVPLTMKFLGKNTGVGCHFHSRGPS